MMCPSHKVDRHHYDKGSEIPHACGSVMALFKEKVVLKTLVASFRGSALVVHGFPRYAVTGRIVIETRIGDHGDAEGSSIFGIRAGIIAGTDAVFHKRAPELCI